MIKRGDGAHDKAGEVGRGRGAPRWRSVSASRWPVWPFHLSSYCYFTSKQPEGCTGLSMPRSFFKTGADAQRRVMRSFRLMPKGGKHQMPGKAGIVRENDLDFTLLEASQCLSF